jgi:hypothetical protein
MKAIHAPIRKTHKAVPAKNDNSGLSKTVSPFNPGRILSMRAIKSVFRWILFGLVLVPASGHVFSLSAQDVKFAAKEPALITTAGQSADLNMAKVIFDRCKVSSKLAPLAGPDDLAGAGSLVVVIGGSTKGLGAAGIDADKEMARVEQLMNAAAARKIPIIGMHIGGKARRGELSDRFIDLVAPRSSFLMVVKEGDGDGTFSRIIANRKIDARIVEKLVDLQEPIKVIYGK